MSLLEIAEKPLVFDVNDRLSKVVSSMYSQRAYDALIFNKKNFVGIISAKDIDRKGLTGLETVKVGSLGTVIKNVKPLDPEAELKDVVNKFVLNDYRCVPLDSSEVLCITKMGLLRKMPTEILRDKKAEDIMFFPECVSPEDPVSVVKSIFRNSHVYRLAVLGKDNRVEGVVDELDLLKTFVEHKKSSKGERSGEKIKESDVSMASHVLIQDSYITVSPRTELKYVVKQMLEKNNDTAVVEEDNKLVGIITPREIFKLIGSDIEGIYVNMSGIHDEDVFLQNLVNSEIRSAIRKLAKIIHMHYMAFNVKKRANPSEGAKTKGRVSYTVRGKLVSNKGAFFADDTSWDLTKSTQSVLKKLEREVIKKVGRERDMGRRDHVIGEERQE